MENSTEMRRSAGRLSKVGMKSMGGITRITLKKRDGLIFVIDDPEVLNLDNSYCIGTHNTAGSVSAADLAPNDTEASAILHSLGTVHVHDLLTEVELDILRVLNTLDLNQVGVVDLLGKRPLEGSHDTLHVQTGPSPGAIGRILDLLAGLGEEFLDVHLWCLSTVLHLCWTLAIGTPMYS